MEARQEELKVNALINTYDFNYSWYLEDLIEDSGIIIDGGRAFKSFNVDTLERVKKYIDDYATYELEYSGCKSTKEYLNCCLPKDNKKSWSGREIATFKDIASKYYSCRSCDYNELAIIILNIITKKNYKLKSIYGCCQGEYAEALIPGNIDNQDVIEDIQGLYFGYGCEILFTDETINEPYDVFEKDYMNIYINSQDHDKIKKAIMECYNNLKPENIILYEGKEKTIIDYVEV